MISDKKDLSLRGALLRRSEIRKACAVASEAMKAKE